MRIYLDTNVFVIAVEHLSDLSDAVQRLMSVGERRPGLFVTSELTLAELLVAPFRMQGLSQLPKEEDHPILLTPGTLAAVYGDLISQRPGLDVVPVDRAVLILAARHRARDNGIKLPDAIHLATAEQATCTHIVTGDRRLRGSQDFHLERVDLDPSALDGVIGKVSSSE